MPSFKCKSAIAATILLGGSIGLQGCFYSSKETEKVGQAPPPVAVQQPTQRVYTYPEGRYELKGDGSTRQPYYWVWIPAGVQSVPPAPPPPPVTAR
jgi:hypothetical protein